MSARRVNVHERACLLCTHLHVRLFLRGSACTLRSVRRVFAGPSLRALSVRVEKRRPSRLTSKMLARSAV